MKFGLFLAVWENQTADIDQKTFLKDVVSYVVEADRLGMEGVFFTEHHFTNLAQIPSTYEVLSYLAAKTNRIRLGTGVTILPWHNPLLLAERAATLDILSDGRFDLGVGRGFRYSECRGFNVPGDELQARFDEGLEVLEKCWREEGRFSHHGRFWHFDDVIIDPKSVQGRHVPVWMSADSETSIRRVARLGYNLMLSHFSDAKATGDRIGYFRDEIESLGQVFDPARVNVTRAFYLTDDPAEAKEARDRHRGVHAKHRPLSVNPNAAPAQEGLYRPPTGHSDDALLIGSKAEITEQLHELYENGIEYVLLMDVSGNKQVLSQFAEEIMPQFSCLAPAPSRYLVAAQ
jgi:alkanesulfonate monooxygenase SsuD/methylene tetrahydromethanopterin reductase-like flavin-dependent oxidoreductase (luciferase family)